MRGNITLGGVGNDDGESKGLELSCIEGLNFSMGPSSSTGANSSIGPKLSFKNI
jgi:hypothetical protein